MIKGVDSILIASENPKVLADFYKEKVGAEYIDEFVYGEDSATGYMLKLGSVGLNILPHSEVHGKNDSPARIMVNIEVDDCEKECQKVKDNGVKVITEMYHMEGYGYIGTFEDPDGNYFQLVQVRSS